ncbi:MAG: hypothetical protein Q8R00_02330 [Candidatus Nanoarchaeia archaeon]|nr:hypothetical protein [Candidatus Nanoarchaeia archaeon]
MGLEKYLLGASIALSIAGCKIDEIVKKPYIRVEEPKKVEVFENVDKPRLGYSSLRLGAGEFGIHKTVLYTPKHFNAESMQSSIRMDLIDKNIESIQSQIISIKQSDLLKATGYGFADEFFYSNKAITFNPPKNKENLIEVLKQTLFQGDVDYKDVGRTLCKVLINLSKNTVGDTNGILIGGNYVLIPANAAYLKLAADEINRINKTNETIEVKVSKTMDMKERSYSYFYQAKVLTVNPLRGLALLEIDDDRFEKNYAKPLFVTMVPELLEAELLTTQTKDLGNKFNSEDEDYKFRGPEEFTEDELNFIRSFRYSIAAISGDAKMRGDVFFTSKGLAGIVDADLSGTNFSASKNYKHLRVINGDLIRNFFEDYLIDLISDHKEEASIFKFVGFEKKEIKDTSIPLEDVLKSEDVRKTPPIAGVPEYVEPEEPRNDFSLLGLLIGFLGMSAFMGYFVYNIIKTPEENKEEWRNWSNAEVNNRLNRLEEVLKPYYIKKEEYEEAKTLNESRILPATSIEVGQDTVDDPNFIAYAIAHSKASEDQPTAIGIGEEKPVTKMNITEADKSLFVNLFLIENIENVEWLSKETKDRIARIVYRYKDEKKKN